MKQSIKLNYLLFGHAIQRTGNYVSFQDHWLPRGWIVEHLVVLVREGLPNLLEVRINPGHDALVWNKFQPFIFEISKKTLLNVETI